MRKNTLIILVSSLMIFTVGFTKETDNIVQEENKVTISENSKIDDIPVPVSLYNSFKGFLFKWQQSELVNR